MMCLIGLMLSLLVLLQLLRFVSSSNKELVFIHLAMICYNISCGLEDNNLSSHLL
jgi:hypothetical protein